MTDEIRITQITVERGTTLVRDPQTKEEWIAFAQVIGILLGAMVIAIGPLAGVIFLIWRLLS